MRRQEESVNASLKEKPFQKVLRIEALLRSGKSHTIEELAKHLGIDNRSVFRYLRRLEITGCQILAKPRNGRTKEYWIAALHTHTDLLSKLKRMDEAMTGGGIRKYHRLLQQTIAHLSSPTIVSGGRSFSPSGRMAATELEIEPCFHLDHGPLAEYLPTGSLREMLMDKLLMAMRAHKVIKLSYNRVERSGAKLVHMEMEPYFLSLRVGKLYLIGVPRSASSSPPVSVVFQRIRMVTETGEEFAPNPRVQMDDFYKYCFGQWVPRGEAKRMEIILQVHETWLLEVLRESHFQPSAVIEAEGRKGAMVHLNLFDTPDLETWLFGLMPHAQVLQPKALRDRLRDRLRRSIELLA